jgi:hypothetical protein
MIRRVLLALTALGLLAASLLIQPAAQAKSAAPAATSVRTWPRHVYAPYFETWTSDSIPAMAWKSEVRYFSLAFIQTARAGSCALTWNGTRSQPVPGPRYQGQIAALRQLGGDVMPTFGGFSADSTKTEIADSCTSVSQIAADYEAVIKGYHVTRLDMDVEVNSLDNKAGIDRRNKAIALVEAWARHAGWPLKIEYTLPVEPGGLEAGALHVLQNAVAALYPGRSASTLWSMEGMTILPGIDDYPGKTEVTHLSDTQQILAFAQAHGLGLLSTWAIQRDNGGCPGAIGSNSCSGVKQAPWAFSHLLEPFTGFF